MAMAHRSKAPLVATLSLLASLFASPFQVPASAQRPSEYEDIVGLFASGDETEALGRLASWSESRVRAHVSRLSDAAATVRRCPGCPGALAFSNSQVRAALLLHARREIQENLLPPKGEQVIRCRTGLHARAVEYLTQSLLLTDSQAPDFLRSLYLAMARQALWSHCLAESRSWAQAGLKLFPKDGPLIMSVGIVYETEAFFTPAPAPSTVLPPSTIRQREAAATRLKRRWETARMEYETAVAAAPDLLEARLRLGRVLWCLGQPEKARAHFEAVIATATATDADSRFLAHLFLGDVYEHRGQAAEAESQYRAAINLEPQSGRAVVALSHVRFLQGDIASAREILAASLEVGPPPAGVDPWVSYLVIQAPEGEHILANLARSLRP